MSWTIKKAEHWRIDAFELWCWRRLLRVPWTARRSNQSILKKISPEYSLEGLILNLKLKYFGYLMQRTDSLEKTLMLGKIEGGRRRGWQRMRWLDGITNSMDMGLGELWEFGDGQGGLACCDSWDHKESDMTEQLNWTEPLFCTFQVHSGKEPAGQWRKHKRRRFDLWVRKIPRRRARQPTPVFLPRESHGQRSLAGYSPWGCKESNWAELNWRVYAMYTSWVFLEFVFKTLGF